MSKSGRSKGRSKPQRKQEQRNQEQSSPPEPAAAPVELGSGGAGPAVGQRLYDMPYSAPAPRMINPELGLHNLVARAGHNAGYDIDLTLLDAPDHRLIRSGVLLAHRILDGRGEWYLGAPDWVPLLPKELIEPMSQAELPEQLADLIRPFRRRAPLGPVAALRCERREFALRDDRGTTMALLRDDKVTVRRGGLTTARYREVTLTPVGPGLSLDQAAFLDETLAYSGATSMTRFPRLVRRLGAPSTGPTDYPEPQPYDADALFGTFLTQLMATRLQETLRSDLAVRAETSPQAAPQLLEQLSRLRSEIAALTPLLDAGWVEDLGEELDWALGSLGPEIEGDFDGTHGERLIARLRGERYLSLLDRLVGAARVAKVGTPDQPVRQVLGEYTTAAVERIRRCCDRLAVDAPSRPWDDARAALVRLADVDAINQLVFGDEVGQRQRRLAESRRLLEEVHAFNRRAEAVLADIEESTPSQAFEAGRQFERDRDLGHAARGEFIQHWAKTRKKLDR